MCGPQAPRNDGKELAQAGGLGHKRGRLSLGCPVQPKRGWAGGEQPLRTPIPRRMAASAWFLWKKKAEGEETAPGLRDAGRSVYLAAGAAGPLNAPCPPPAAPAITQAVAPQISHEIGTLRGALKLEI